MRLKYIDEAKIEIDRSARETAKVQRIFRNVRCSRIRIRQSHVGKRVRHKAIEIVPISPGQRHCTGANDQHSVVAKAAIVDHRRCNASHRKKVVSCSAVESNARRRTTTTIVGKRIATQSTVECHIANLAALDSQRIRIRPTVEVEGRDAAAIVDQSVSTSVPVEIERRDGAAVVDQRVVVSATVKRQGRDGCVILEYIVVGSSCKTERDDSAVVHQGIGTIIRTRRTIHVTKKRQHFNVSIVLQYVGICTTLEGKRCNSPQIE